MTEVEALRVEVNHLYRVLGTLISWMAQSANSPIRADEAKTLLARLAERPEPSK